MISVCASIHNSPKSVEAFIRSIYDNATGEDFEVILVSDRNPPEEDALLRQLATSFPRLSLIPVGNCEQGARQWNLISFWRSVYDDKLLTHSIADHAVSQLLRYERDGIDLWFQYAYGLNLAANKAKGEFLLLTPADFVVMCDVHKLGKVIEGYATTHDGRFFGHFSLVAPFDRKGSASCVEDGPRHPRFKDVFLSTWNIDFLTPAPVIHLMREHTDRTNYPVTPGIDRYWPFNHGIRVVDAGTFHIVGGLWDDFLSKPGPTNIFNRMARALVYGPELARVNLSIEEQTGFRARMASVPFDDDPPIEYLYPTPCDGETVRKMQVAEENRMMREHPELKGLWE